VTEGRVRDASMPRYSNLDFLRPLLVPERSPLGREIVVGPFRTRTPAAQPERAAARGSA